MSETPSNSGQSRQFTATATELARALNWIHTSIDSGELRAIVQQIARDAARGATPLVRTLIVDHQIVAAAYFRRLAGRTATLGGIRAEAGFELNACRMLKQLTERLEALGNRQIQAIVENDDRESQDLLIQSGFAPLTTVQQLWLDIGFIKSTQTPKYPTLTWIPAAERSRNELTGLISETFVGTLDCPMLNNIRSPDDVLDGFLEGKEITSALDWFILSENDQDVGCIFLCQHTTQLVELVYLGLLPNARGKRLGEALVRKAISVAEELGAKILVAGVDATNYPAVKTYQRMLFQKHRTMQVYFRNVDILRMAKAS